MKTMESLVAGTIRMVSVLAACGIIALVWAYRLFLAPLFPATCRYSPSCSAYAIEALRRHGPIKGAWLAARRLLACHPWGDHGHDPVPEACSYRDLLTLRRGRP